jgi:tetratricopeptide (TPR) repeat protein
MRKLIYQILLGASLAAGVAHADGKLDAAKAHLQSGAALYEENNFHGALAEFQRAYELAPSYKILFNIAQVELELQDHAGAFKAYTRYLREGGPDLAPARRAQVELELERLGGRVGFLVIQTAAGAQVVVDEAPVGYAPLPEPVAVSAGKHRVTVIVPGREPITRVFDVAGHQDVTAALTVEPLVVSPARPPPSTVPRPPPPPDPPASKTPMYAAWSITGGLAAGAGVLALITRGDANALAALRSRYPVTPEQLAAQRSRTVRDAAVTDVLAGAAVASAGVALYLTVTRMAGEPTRSRERAVQLQVAPTGVALAGRF